MRNAIAIALADIQSTDAIEPLLCMVSDPKTKGARGTLLYALESFDCLPYVEWITTFLSDESFEVNRQAFILIENMIERMPTDLKEKCVNKIQNEINRLHEKLDFLDEAKKLFEQADNFDES